MWGVFFLFFFHLAMCYPLTFTSLPSPLAGICIRPPIHLLRGSFSPSRLHAIPLFYDPFSGFTEGCLFRHTTPFGFFVVLFFSPLFLVDWLFVWSIHGSLPSPSEASRREPIFAGLALDSCKESSLPHLLRPYQRFFFLRPTRLLLPFFAVSVLIPLFFSQSGF